MSGAHAVELELHVKSDGSDNLVPLAARQGQTHRFCFWCGKSYEPVQAHQRFCSTSCKKEKERDQWRKGRASARSGIAAASKPRTEVLELARDIAKRVALSRQTRTCSADDVYEELCIRGLQDQLGPAAGAIFRTDDWQFDRYIESKRLTNNGRVIRRWRYVGHAGA